MFNNRFPLVLGVLSLLLVTIAIAYPRAAAPVTAGQGANDFYQRHPAGTNNDHDVVIPVTGITAAADYYQRHPELRLSVGVIADTSDYFIRHPELRPFAKTIDLSDYFLRH
ncbi:MAG: hypothetical protein EHM33_11455 [Chloroflexi bacterium]|jgi:hypothetical protein|nr:MAG: hypothetical protein EHM33_11455 [Chloroflexota bacterium]